jgi:hypothetical protein
MRVDKHHLYDYLAIILNIYKLTPQYITKAYLSDFCAKMISILSLFIIFQDKHE